MNQRVAAQFNLILRLSAGLGVLSFGVALLSHHIADADLWAKLALGAWVCKHGTLPQTDCFAFTPVLDRYVDHEWGAGAIFFGLLKLFGPQSLMWLKLLLAFGAVVAALWTARRAGSSWPQLLLLAVPAVPCILLGYIPVIRCHAFTYCFFAVTLFGLEEIRRASALNPLHQVAGFPPSSPLDERAGERRQSSSAAFCRRMWPAALIVVVMMIWTNVHGGFVAGLGTVAIYTAAALFNRNTRTTMLVLALMCVAVTSVNPYGIRFWSYLLPAVLSKRPLIAEWQPLPLFAVDVFMPFRILFAITVAILLLGWKGTRKSVTGLAMLAITALLAWRSRRHAPFFGVAALAFLGPYLGTTFSRFSRWLPRPLQIRANPAIVVVAIYSLVALYSAVNWLPNASFQILAPVGHDPVREADILMRAEAKGNLATPFHWGSYLAWRLYPDIKVSMDGRYEAAYPESTFQLNNALFDRAGADWDRLLHQFPVDYVILDLAQERLRPSDLESRGYVLIWVTEGSSALLALEKHAEKLRQVARSLPAMTINPLDAKITDKWW